MKLRSLAIEPANRCNLRCPECYGRPSRRRPGRPQGDMSMELFNKISREARKLDITSLGMHFNGEPTLHPLYPEMLRAVGDLGFKTVRYSTNGIGVSDEVVRSTIESGVYSVNISVHTTSDEPIELAKRLRAARTKASQKRPKITSTFSFNGAPESEIDKLYNRYKDNVDTFGITGRIEGMRWVNIPKSAVPVPRSRCHQPLRYLAALWDGRLTICCRDLAGQLAFGDVSKRSIAEEIDSRISARRQKETMESGRPKDQLCQSCNLWQTIYRWAVYTG